jgi:hypothetical protein
MLIRATSWIAVLTHVLVSEAGLRFADSCAGS